MKAMSTKRLVLHFNIDKTIICKDPYNGLDTIPATLADCVAKMSWGAVTVDEDDAKKWTLALEGFSHEQPEEDLMTYKDFMEIEYAPRSRLDEGETQEQLDEYNINWAIEKKEKLLNFSRPGQPGSKFKSQVEKLNRATLLPKNVREELGLNNPTKEKEKEKNQKKKTVIDTEGEGEGDTEEQEEEEEEEEEETEEQKLIKLFEDQKYFILPSFFKTLIYLKKAKREFSVVIRGEDEFIKPVVFEFNKFWVGEHPCFCGRSGTPTIKFDGSKNTKYCIIDDKCKANFYRFDDCTKMLFGTLDQEKLDEISSSKDMDDVFYDEIDNKTRVVGNDGVECYAELMELFKKYCTVAIREDKDVNRVLYVDPADYNTQHIYFDAKWIEQEQCRITVKDIITGSEISFKDSINKFIAVVETHRAVLEPDYFMKLIEMCEYTRDQEIEARESGKLDEAEQKQLEINKNLKVSSSVAESQENQEEGDYINEWDKLQGLSHDQYLIQTVMPILSQGLKMVATERPKWPIKAIALYMLKNQDKVKLPSK
jgi:hypothetical protein